ncbi:MAG: HNH endonuclease [Clostridia bacterium]|nr:HNH endonuclease [Clostridia bacterium]
MITLLSASNTYPKFLIEQENNTVSVEFTSNRKSEVFIKQAFPAALKCPICGGLLHVNSISIDHIIRKEDGGDSQASNGQATHFYCNTTYKN